MHVVVAAHPAQRPGGIGGIRTQGVQRCGGVCRQRRQRAALDGLHDDEGHAALLGQLIAVIAGDLLGAVVPIKIVVLQLAEIPRLVAQNVLKPGRVVMAGKSKVPDASCSLLLPQPVHKAHGFCLFVPGSCAGGVQQIEVDVFNAQPLELLFKKCAWHRPDFCSSTAAFWWQDKSCCGPIWQ